MSKVYHDSPVLLYAASQCRSEHLLKAKQNLAAQKYALSVYVQWLDRVLRVSVYNELLFASNHLLLLLFPL